MPLSDHRVRYRDEKAVEEAANIWRKEARAHFKTDYFPMASFLKDVVQKGSRSQERLSFKFINRLDDGPPAKVTYKPLTLHVRANLWTDVVANDNAVMRYILAHEMGHITLHDHHAQPFSSVDGRRLSLAEKYISAEWQADTFADCLLMPREIVERTSSAHDLAVRCGVEVDRAVCRQDDVEEFWRKNGECGFEQCDNCFQYETLRLSGRVRCTICKRMVNVAI